MKKILCVLLSLLMAAGSFSAVYETNVTPVYAGTYKSTNKKLSV